MSFTTAATVLCVSVLSIFIPLDSDPQCILKIGNSEFEGKCRLSWTGKSFCSFYGIPYAISPKRFEASALNKVQWTGLKRFTSKQEKCLQYGITEGILVGQEDCLYLDIHTNLKASQSQSVLVWLHGGTFNFGSGQEDIIRPDVLIERDIVVVTVNYRLGPLGFFSYPHKNIVKNLGLKDQITALKWTQKYIKYFRGNSKDVTLAGWSAGGAAVTYHLYTDLSRGLFHKAIAMSGTFLNPWAFNIASNSSGTDWCDFYNISCNESDNLQRLQEVPLDIDEFVASEFCFIHYNMYFPCFLPTLESNDGKNMNASFVWEQPHKLVNSKPKIDVPLLMGFTNLEETCDVFSPNEFIISNLSLPNFREDVVEFLTELLTDEKFNKEKYEKFTKLRRIADTIFGVITFADKYTENSESPVYMYNFSLPRKRNKKVDRRCTVDSDEGAFHGDDIKLLFGQYFQVRKIFGRNVRNTQIEMSNLWANFIHYGNPSPVNMDNTILPKWPRYDNNKIIMNINETLSVRSLETTELFSLWSLVYDCFYNSNCDALLNLM